MAFTEFYVDPSLDSDSGAGTISDPAGDLEWLIEQNDWPAAPTRVNVKAGTTEILGADLSVAMADVSAPSKSVAWTPEGDLPLVIQGYTSVAGDGGVGSISGGGLVSIFNDQLQDGMNFYGLELTNVGANYIVWADNDCSVIRCHVHGCTGTDPAINLGVYGSIKENYVHDFTDIGITATNGVEILANYVDMRDGESVDRGIYASTSSYAANNIVIMPDNCGSSVAGMRMVNAGGCVNNTVYCGTGGSGKGIWIAQPAIPHNIRNNLVQGLNGVGGYGIQIDNVSIQNIVGNAVYDCTTPYLLTGEAWDPMQDNETLTESPFVDAANGDFTPRDIGNVIEGSLPNVIGGGFV